MFMFLWSYGNWVPKAGRVRERGHCIINVLRNPTTRFAECLLERATTNNSSVDKCILHLWVTYTYTLIFLCIIIQMYSVTWWPTSPSEFDCSNLTGYTSGFGPSARKPESKQSFYLCIYVRILLKGKPHPSLGVLSKGNFRKSLVLYSWMVEF